MIELKHLRTLQALRAGGSLAAAAARLHQTQSALSHQFSELEQRLGYRLFVRKASLCALPPKARSCWHWRIRCCHRCSRPYRHASTAAANAASGH